MGNVRDYVYKDDVNRAFIAAMDSDADYNIFNIGSGSGVSVADVVKVIEQELSFSLELKHEVSPGAEHLADWCVLDTGRAQKYLVWQANTSLGTGIRKMITEHRSLMPDLKS